MSESKHTPGPWQAMKTLGEDYQIKSQPHGTRGFTHLIAYAETEENARLIAAGPDLLEAILKSDDAHWTPAMRAAIVKATKP